MPNEFVIIAGWDRRDYRWKRSREGKVEGKSREFERRGKRVEETWNEESGE